MGLVDAVVLSGRRNEGELRSVSTVEWEALIDLLGTPMTGWVIRALQASEQVARVFVVGPEELRPLLRPQDELIEPGETMLENAARGARAAAAERPVLFCTGDVAMLTTKSVDELLEKAAGIRADVWYPVVPRPTVEARFPGNKRTYVRLRDGSFTGGNLLLVGPGARERVLGQAEAIVAMRKKPLQLARMVGLGFVLRLIIGRATVSDAEQRFSSLLGVTARAVVSSHPEVGVDIDHPSDIPYCEHELRLRQGGTG